MKAAIERAERSIPNSQRRSEQGTFELKSQLIISNHGKCHPTYDALSWHRIMCEEEGTWWFNRSREGKKAGSGSSATRYFWQSAERSRGCKFVARKQEAPSKVSMLEL